MALSGATLSARDLPREEGSCFQEQTLSGLLFLFQGFAISSAAFLDTDRL
jgi:hypothetical protein